jgi:phosphoribosylaminoimidazole-succinocarboxamide synthase
VVDITLRHFFELEPIMRGKIALEEHVSTPENNRLWDSTGEANRNGSEYMLGSFIYSVDMN